MRDPSSFYRLNEAIAAELARLDAAGHLARLRELTGEAGVELLLTSIREREGLEELVGGLGPGGWDAERYLATRSQFNVVLPEDGPREVYMPDHICPACLNEDGNVIDGCARRCQACAFAW